MNAVRKPCKQDQTRTSNADTPKNCKSFRARTAVSNETPSTRTTNTKTSICRPWPISAVVSNTRMNGANHGPMYKVVPTAAAAWCLLEPVEKRVVSTM